MGQEEESAHLVDTVMGMPITWNKEDSDIFPIGALVVTVGMGHDGIKEYAVKTAGDLQIVEALGLAHYLLLYVEDTVRETIANAVGEKESTS